MQEVKPTILIIFGITGDLSSRKLLPAISKIANAHLLPEHFHIIGTTRQANVDIDKLLLNIENGTSLKKFMTIFQMELNDEAHYGHLADKLKEIEDGFGTTAEHLFYLSVPPVASQSIIELLGTSNLSKVEGTKLLLEKPFGVDLLSASLLIEKIDKYFTSEQVYRIDHYLAKEMTQNIIVIREHNSLFKRTWNNNFIERIEILASENIGIEGRANFYEQTGTLRDVVQNHLLQLTAVTLMDANDTKNASDIPSRRLDALKNLSIAKDKPLIHYVKRGQYKKYKEEVANINSTTETFLSLTLSSSSPRWVGVPIEITAGKMLNEKITEVRVYYKKDMDMESNELVLKMAPKEGIVLNLWSKRPGYEKQIEKCYLQFNYSEHYDMLPEAYEQVLLDSLHGDHSLFTSSEEIIESWRIVSPIQEAWKKSSDDLFIYQDGSNARSLKGD